MTDLRREEVAEQFLDHGKFPFHRGMLANATHTRFERNVTCGDQVWLQLLVDGVALRSAWFDGHGCIVSQAFASMLCKQIDGRPLKDVLELTEQDVLNLAEFYLNPVRQRCALISFKALRSIVSSM